MAARKMMLIEKGFWKVAKKKIQTENKTENHFWMVVGKMESYFEIPMVVWKKEFGFWMAVWKMESDFHFSRVVKAIWKAVPNWTWKVAPKEISKRESYFWKVVEIRTWKGFSKVAPRPIVMDFAKAVARKENEKIWKDSWMATWMAKARAEALALVRVHVQ